MSHRSIRSAPQPALPRLRSLLLGLAAILAAAPGAATASTAAATVDPAIGKWLGTCGSPRERVAVGLEFRPGAGGAIELYLTLPILNAFGVAVPEVVKREGDRVTVEALHLDLTLRDGRLEGFYPGPRSPATLTRVESLPAETPIPALPKGPGPRWQTRLSGQIYASPTVAGTVAYVGTTGGVMNALDTRDGKILWVFAAGRPVFGAATVAGGALYFVCDNGYLFKLEPGTGKELWRYDLGDARVPRVLPHPQAFEWDWQGATPAVADGVVYVGAGDGGFHAVDAATGTVRWRFATGGRIRNGAAIDGARVVVGSADHFVYALDRATGREIWKYDTQAEVDATPVVHDGRVLIGNRGPGLYALVAATGELVWRTFFWGSWVESTPVVADGTIYIGASDLRRVSAIDPADGRVLWRSDVRGWTWGTPLIDGDRIYAGAAGGKPYAFHHVASLTALDRATGEALWRWPLDEVSGAHQWGVAGSPALAGDTLVITTIEGSVYGFGRP